MTKRKSVPVALAFQVKERYGGRCAKCGRKKNLEIHRINPVVYGGRDELSNLIPLCSTCHWYTSFGAVGLIKFLSSPYPVIMGIQRDLTLTLCKYFAEAPKEKIEELRDLGGEKYFTQNFKPMFDGLRALAWGFDENEEDSQ